MARPTLAAAAALLVLCIPAARAAEADVVEATAKPQAAEATLVEAKAEPDAKAADTTEDTAADATTAAPESAPVANEAKPRNVIAPPAADERQAQPVVAEAVAVAEDAVVDGAADVDTEKAATGPAPEKPEAKPDPRAPQPEGVTFSGIPAINYIADNGLGLGVIAAAYFHDGVTAPYRTAVTLQIFASTNLVQDHNVIIDTLRLFDQPLRLNARVGYLSSLTQNYCGVGGTVSCDVGEAESAATAAGLEEGTQAFADFARRYYQRRFMNPYGLVNLRYALIERAPGQQTRVEVTGGYRAFYFIPGNVFADEDGDGAPDFTPYPGSLYEKDFADGEPGLSSVINAGIMIDSRDNEPAPTEGWFTEASVRATTPGLSTWNNVGFNLTVRGYTHLPVDAPIYGNLGRRLVLANRLTFDGVLGDVPIQELARLGGSQDIYAFGGADMGRGIRVQRYMGKAKLLDQAELRFRFFEFDFLEQKFALTLAGFLDTAIVADELIDPEDVGVAAAGGGAFRIAWNENFIIRLDVGVSPVENWSPQIYITINQPF